jgi:SAM-dependent methyltransferase
LFNPPDYSATKNFLNPKLGPWTVLLYLHRKKILDSVKKAEPYLKGRLLDVGCGNKPYSSLFHTEEYIGIDVATSLHDKKIFDFTYDGINLPFRDNEFNSIICTEVLEHSVDPVALMKEMYRVLKVDGYALITVPMFLNHHEIPYDFCRFTYYGLRKDAEDSGFIVESIEDRGNHLSVLIAAIYISVSNLVSLRPFSDIVYWLMFPFTCLILLVDKKINHPAPVSLGWQMLIKK